MAKSDGAVYIETLMDTKGFSKGMNSIESRIGNLKGAIGKLGGVIAATFAVQKLVQFGKEAIDLGSDLQEVQNVVDVTFTTMSEKVNEFAKNAAESAGLSETMAKRYTGTFGAMAKAFGFAESESFNMSTALTQLAGDVASFYNISQDEAYTKLKSVFTGETETLKDLGVVMTQSALDSYALAKGMGKTTKQMSEQEKVALRYSFVLDQLSAAQGDFARTSDSWANQTRILSLNFDTFKANIGQALINIFTPFLKVINQIVSKMAQLSSYFVAFSEMLVGKSTSGGGGSPGAVLEDMAGGYDDVASSAQKAEKAQNKYLSGLDEIRTFSSKDSGSEAGAVMTGAIGNLNIGNVPKQNEELEKTNGIIDSILERCNEIANLFSDGFLDGAGNIMDTFGIIEISLGSIKNNVSKIFGEDLRNSFNQMVDLFSYSFGQIIGSLGSIGTSIGANLLGGLSRYLQSDNGRIKQFLIDMLDISGEIAAKTSEWYDSIAYIAEVIAGESGQNITSHILGIFSELFMGMGEILGRLQLDITTLLTQPFIDSKEEIKTSLEDLLDGFSEVTEFFDELVEDVVDSEKKIYDEIISPIFDNATERITEFIEEHLTPLISRIGKFLDSLGESLLLFWDNVLKPIIDWIIENILPVIVPIIDTIVNAVEISFGFIADLFSGFLQILTGVIDFITGVFTGDWEKAWEGVKGIFKGIINSIISIIEYFVNHAINALNGVTGVVNKITGIVGIPEIPKIPEVNIPKLATGAVIPPNAPFVAMLGDQKHGNNIEAPEDLIRKIVREETGSGNISGNVPISIFIDGNKFLEVMISKAKLMQASTGINVFAEL